MSTHVNFAAIVPNTKSSTTFDVVIVRGVEASGNSGNVRFEWIICGLNNIDDAIAVCRAAPHISALNFYKYAKGTP